MKNIELYIEDYKVDLDKEVSINLTKQLNDIFDPSKLKNDYSKTISIPSTKTNNEIFGNIFGLNKTIKTEENVLIGSIPYIGQNYDINWTSTSISNLSQYDIPLEYNYYRRYILSLGSIYEKLYYNDDSLIGKKVNISITITSSLSLSSATVSFYGINIGVLLSNGTKTFTAEVDYNPSYPAIEINGGGNSITYNYYNVYLYTPIKKNIGKNFNPSKKSNFKLFLNNDLLTSGYIKLLEIKYLNNENINRYEIALFGELGNFLTKFEDKTIKDILSVSTSPYYTNKILLSLPDAISRGYNYTFKNLYDARKNQDHNRDNIELSTLYTTDYTIDTRFITGYKNIYLDLINSENGLYDDGNKLHDNSIVTDPKKPNIAEIDLNGKYTETQMCVKNELKQKIGFYIDKVLIDCIKSIGYQLDITEFDWISKENPYWYNLMFSTDIPDKTGNDFNLTLTGSTFDSGTTTTGGFTHYSYSPKPSSITGDLSGFTIGSLQTTKYPSSGTYDVRYTPIETDNNIPNYNFNLKYSKDNLSATQSIFRISGLPSATPYYYPELDVSATNIFQSFYEFEIYVINSDSGLTNKTANLLYGCKLIDQTSGGTIYTNDNNYFTFRIWNNNGSIDSRIEVLIDKDNTWKKLDDLLSEKVNEYLVLLNSYTTTPKHVALVYKCSRSDSTQCIIRQAATPRYVKDYGISYRQTPFRYYINGNTTVVAGSTLRYSNLLPGIKFIDFLTSYLKTFGLYLEIDDYYKKVKILSRNKFYKNYKILDWDDKYCYDKESSCIPLNFDSKYIILSHKESGSDLTTKYNSEYNRPYGSVTLNTGYDFNAEKFNILKDTIFCNYVMGSVSRDYWGYNPDPNVIPFIYNDDISQSKRNNSIFLCFNSGYYKSTDRTVKLPYSGGQGMYYGFYIPGIYYQNNIKKQIKYYNFIQTDFKLDPYGNPDIYFDPQNDQYGSYGELVSTGNKYLNTGAFYPSHKNIQYSLDFGVPLIKYFNDDYTEDSTIYNRLFSNYLEDRYNLNTKIYDAYFYLNESDFNRFKFKDFIYFKNKYWVVNKISDYNPLSTEPTKVQLISVNNIDNYTKNQNLIRNDLVLNFNFDEGKDLPLEIKNRYICTIPSPNWTNGLYTNGLYFSGNTNICTINNFIDDLPNNSFSVSFWIYWSGFTNKDSILISKTNWNISISGNNIRALVINTGNSSVYYSDNFLVGNKWYMITIIYNATTKTISHYEDENLMGNSVLVSGTGDYLGDSSYELKLGETNTGADYIMNNLKIYNSILTSDEVLMLNKNT